MNSEKKKRFFRLKDARHLTLGHGTYYQDGGNVQVYMKSHQGAAWQLSTLADVLMLEGVESFEWIQEISEVERGNLLWNRVDGAYNPSEFRD